MAPGGIDAPEPRRVKTPAPQSGPRQPTVLTWVALSLLLLAMWRGFSPDAGGKAIPYSEFKARLERGEIEQVIVGEAELRGVVRPPGAKDEDTWLFRSVRVSDETLVANLDARGVEYRGERTSGLAKLLVAWILPLALLVALWAFLMRRAGGQARSMLSIGKSHARLVAEHTGVTFEDVAGCDEAKAELEEVVDFLRNPGRYVALGARIPKGVLLVGPPGTGKTLLARAVAGEAGVPFFEISGSDFVEMFVGVGASRVRDLFENAKKRAPCIVFIDELDAIGRQRGVHLGTANDEREQTLNQLLVELDGFSANEGVIVLSATNRPDVLDAALLRPGRFDRQVVVDAPDRPGREAVLRVHAHNKPLADDVDLARLAAGTPGLVGADLANVLNEASLLAARLGQHTITQADLETAVEKVVAGPERRSRRLNPETRRRVAGHEAGHALVAWHCPGADPVHKISIVPRGHAALGYTLQLPGEDHYVMTRDELLDRMRGLLGGRAAEALLFGDVSTGAEDDLQKATVLARRMVTMYGMSESLGLLHCGLRNGPARGSTNGEHTQQDCADTTATLIDDEVRALLAAAYADAQRILSEHREDLERVAARLLEVETLDAGGFSALVEPATHA